MQAFDTIGIPVDELFDKVDSLIFVFDDDGRIIYANAYWFKTLGYDQSIIGRMHVLDDLFVTDGENQPDWYQHVLAGQDVPDLHGQLRDQSGQMIHVEGSFIPRIKDTHIRWVTGVFHDITGHHARGNELTRAFELAGDMLGIVDYDGYFLKINPAWQATTGYPVSDVIGRQFIEFVHPDDVSASLAELERMITKHETSWAFENRYVCADGSVKWFSWNATPYPDTRQVFFVARDITERKKTEQQLDEAIQQLRAILDNSGALIYLKDVDGRYTLINKEFESLLGKKSHEIIGKRDIDLFDVETADQIAEHDRKALYASQQLQFEERLPAVDGIHTYLVNKFVLNTPEGDAYAVCSIATDITYRKQTEVQLLLRNQAIEFSPTCISIADATLPDLPLIYINPAFERTTGYSAMEVIGRNCRFLQNDDRDQEGLQEVRAAIREQRSCVVTIRNYRKDGTLFYNELRLAPIRDADGHLTHYVGISMDVSDRVEAADKIKSQNEALMVANRALATARKQAEDATRLKSQFLATMSHELRTPLNAIIGYTEIMLAGMTGELTSEQRDYHERVSANADHLLQLINDILDLSKIEAGRMEIVNKPFNVQKWLDDVIAVTKGLAEEKHLEFLTVLDERLPPQLVGDSARIKQIAINLLTNAIKFTNSGYVKIQLRKHGRDAFKLIVQDTGIGIPSHMQETIFEEFRQVDSSSQRKQGGTGLGLSIVRKLALMMGGNIRVKSQVNAGTEFTVILPLVEK